MPSYKLTLTLLVVTFHFGPFYINISGFVVHKLAMFNSCMLSHRGFHQDISGPSAHWCGFVVFCFSLKIVLLGICFLLSYFLGFHSPREPLLCTSDGLCVMRSVFCCLMLSFVWTWANSPGSSHFWELQGRGGDRREETVLLRSRENTGCCLSMLYPLWWGLFQGFRTQNLHGP